MLKIVLPVATAVCLAVGGTTAIASPAAAGPVVVACGVHGPSVRARTLVPVTMYVTNLNDSGPNSLRAAILAANSMAPGTPVTIDFDVAGVITLASDLPAITSHVKIDGTSAPGHVTRGAPVVEVNGNSHAAGFRFIHGSAGSQLLGLAIGNTTGNGVTISANNVTVNGNHIGLNRAGTPLPNLGDGVFLDRNTAGNVIGLNTSGASGAVANVISGNRGAGIRMIGSSRNTVAANRIGTNRSGTVAIGNRHGGIEISAGSNRNVIGGTLYTDSATGKSNNPTGSEGAVPEVYVVPPLGNLVSGNARNGILINGNSQFNMLNGNFVGTRANGDSALPNALDGVRITGAHNNTLQGCKFKNNPFVYYNVLSGNGGNGLHVTNSNNVTVQANFFGIGANNTTLVPNKLNGMLFDGTSKNDQVGGVIPLGNVSAGNRLNGIELRDTVSGFITFNTFGGLLAFKGPAPNGQNGLLVSSTGGNNLARTNVFSGNTGNGIQLTGDATGVTIDPNIVGLTTNGKTKMPNGANGLLISGRAHGNVVGGTRRSVIPQNLFSGNLGYGIAIIDQAHDNQVLDTFIGTTVFGTSAASNNKGGVFIGGAASNNLIGGSPPASRAGTATRGDLVKPSDIISGNGGPGVTLTDGTRSNLVLNNYLGLDRFGRALPNQGGPYVNTGRNNRFVGNSTVPR